MYAKGHSSGEKNGNLFGTRLFIVQKDVGKLRRAEEVLLALNWLNEGP